MIQSTFSQKPKSQLVYIANQLIQEDFNFEIPYDDFNRNIRILQNFGQYLGEAISTEDVQFFAKFIELNEDLLSEIFETKDKSLYDKLIIPIPKDYEIKYDAWGYCKYDEYYKSVVTCYDEGWVRDMVKTDYMDGNWDLYQGRLIDTEYDNYEMDDWAITYVREKENVKESLLAKLVLENTSSVLDSVDRETLLKMKSLIENKLRSL